MLASPTTALTCGRCQRELRGAAYELSSREGRLARCLRCVLLYWPLVRRSFLVCLAVGTVLVAVNQGDVILRGDFPMALAWKIPLTYAAPYWVATAGAVLNARSQRTAV